MAPAIENQQQDRLGSRHAGSSGLRVDPHASRTRCVAPTGMIPIRQTTVGERFNLFLPTCIQALDHDPSPELPMHRTPVLSFAVLSLLVAAGASARGIDVEKVNGSIHIESGQQAGDLGTVNGGIHIENSGSAEKVSTVNGGIELSRLSGKIEAETVNGGIVAREISGPIEATTTNGGVDVDLTSVAKGGVKLGCTNGAIKLRLPSDAAATISASVANGGIDADGMQLEKTESSRRSLEARMNGGGPTIKISGTNGGIKISAR